MKSPSLQLMLSYSEQGKTKLIRTDSLMSREDLGSCANGQESGR